MRRFSIAMLSLAALAALVSCATTDTITENDKLTPREYKELVAKCRKKAMCAPPSKEGPLSSEDKQFIRTHPPKFAIQYYGHKIGKYKMWWKLNDYHIVKVVGKGDILSDKCPTYVVTVFTK